MADAPAVHHVSELRAGGATASAAPRALRGGAGVLLAHWRLFLSIVGSLLLVCTLYCLVAPRQYEARARVALCATPLGAVSLDSTDAGRSGSFASAETRLETLASVLRSDQLAWRVIVDRRLYAAPALMGRFAARFPEFRPEAPAADAQAYLLERFQNAFHVRTVPRTLVLEMRFRSRDAGLSAEVLNDLIRAEQEQSAQAYQSSAAQATGWLNDQLKDLKSKTDGDERRLADFQKRHGLLIPPEGSGSRHASASEDQATFFEVDELGRELVAATSERILREAEFQAASQGDPELVLASDPRLQAESGGISVAAFRQIHQRRAELEQEQALLAAEHGPNFPRVVEVRDQMEDLDGQLAREKAMLRERFRSAWRTAADREQMVRKSLAQLTREGEEVNAAAAQYESMRREADATHELYVRMESKAEEAGLAAGVAGAEFWVVDPAHTPAKPVSPDLPLYLAVTLFAGVWIAAGVVFMVESWETFRARKLFGLVVIAAALSLHAQAPTPSTSGLPTGVVKLPPTPDTKNFPNPREAPPVWNGAGTAAALSEPKGAAYMSGPIVPGEVLEIAEYQTPEFRSVVRVSAAGVVTLPMIGDIDVSGLDEAAAARAIAAKLVAKGMLLHPKVTVLITTFVGMDVTVLGEVARPGVYPYGVHHRLLDLISAASGLNVTAGGLVNIMHRDDPGTPQMITLDFAESAGPAHNPELRPGDLVQVSRAGLVYVVGDVNRPGGFTLDPAQATTVLQALSLAWGPSQNAALKNALLIHARDDGRTVTALNLKRMLRGQDPDIPVGERDILFVPDSAARNLWNRTMESVVQSAAGVSIYAGLVYSQRF